MLPKIENVTFEIELPSTKEKVTMRNMKVKEEKILLTAKESKDAGDILNAVKQVVNNCMVSDIDVDKIATFDLEYLFIQLRAQSVSDVAEVSYIDNDEYMNELQEALGEDGEEKKQEEVERAREKARRNATRSFKIPLAKVTVKFPEESDRRIPIDDKRGILLRYPSAQVWSDKRIIEGNPEDTLDLLIASCVESFYEGDKVTEPTEEDMKNFGAWIETLPVKVHNRILEFFEKRPMVFYEIKFKNKLGVERVITLTTLNDFFQFV